MNNNRKCVMQEENISEREYDFITVRFLSIKFWTNSSINWKKSVYKRNFVVNLEFLLPFLSQLLLILFAISWRRCNYRRSVQPILPRAAGWFWGNNDREVVTVASACNVCHFSPMPTTHYCQIWHILILVWFWLQRELEFCKFC